MIISGESAAPLRADRPGSQITERQPGEPKLQLFARHDCFLRRLFHVAGCLASVHSTAGTLHAQCHSDNPTASGAEFVVAPGVPHRAQHLNLHNLNLPESVRGMV